MDLVVFVEDGQTLTMCEANEAKCMAKINMVKETKRETNVQDMEMRRLPQRPRGVPSGATLDHGRVGPMLVHDFMLCLPAERIVEELQSIRTQRDRDSRVRLRAHHGGHASCRVGEGAFPRHLVAIFALHQWRTPATTKGASWKR